MSKQSELEKWVDESSSELTYELREKDPQAWFEILNKRFGRREGALHLLKVAEEWCGINAYDSDKGPCDEHTCDDSRGRQCSADELLYFLKSYCGKGRGE